MWILCTKQGHLGGRVTPRTYAGMARDLSTLVANFKPGMGTRLLL